MVKPHDTRRKTHDAKGAALIIVIFAMLVFAILGWTLVNLQSGSFLSNLSTLDSERAFNLAEAGQEWAIQQLVLNEAWRTQDTGADADCNDPGDWENYILSPGEYRVCCRNATISEQLIGNIVIESQGYIPSVAKPRSIRQTKLILDIGSFDKVLIAKNLFDWSAIHAGSTMDGNIQALNYEGDGDSNPNEEGIDYRSGASPLPPGTGKNTLRIIASTPFPAIDMAYYEAQAKTPSYKPLNEDNIWAPALTATITNILFEGGKTKIDIAPAFPGDATQWVAQAIRNISGGSWQDGTWAVIDAVNASGNTLTLDRVVSWKLGERITLIPKILSIARAGNIYTIDFSCDVFTPPFSKWKNEAIRNFSRPTSNNWPYSDWGVITNNPTARQVKVTLDSSVNLDTNPWTIGQWVGIVKRYNGNVNDEMLWYIMSDALLDLRASNITFKKTALIAEGDIAIKGAGNEKLHFTQKPSAYPNVGTKNGNVISLDTPGSTGNDGARRQRRDFDDLVYTENGTLNFNYLDARAAYGNNIIFDGEIKLKYDKKLDRRLTGFVWGLSNAQWQEE